MAWVRCGLYGLCGVSKTTANMGQGSSGSAWQSIKQKVGLGGQGKNPGIVGQILGDTDASSIGKMAQSVDQAFSKVSSRIKTFVSETQAQINKLNGSISKLGGGAGGGNGPSGYSYSAPGMPSTGFTSSSGGYSAPGGLNYGGGQQGSGVSRSTPPAPSSGEGSGGGSGGGGGLGWRGRSANALLGGGIGSLFGQGTAGTVIGGMMGETGISKMMAPFMGGIGVGAAAVKLYDFAAQSFESVRAGRANWTLNKPFEQMQAAAGVASVPGGVFSAVNKQDLGYVMAFNRVMNSKKIQDSINNIGLRREEIALKFADSPLSSTSAIRAVKDWAQSGASDTLENIMTSGGPQGLSEVDRSSLLGIARQKALMEAPQQLASQINTGVQNQMALTPMQTMLANDVYGNAMGRVRALRSVGMSAGIVAAKVSPYSDEVSSADSFTSSVASNGREVARTKVNGSINKWNKENAGSVYEMHVAKLNKDGWDISDEAAGRQQILGIGAGYGGALGRIEAVSAGIGGLSNIADLTKFGGILGGSVGAARAFKQQVQHSIGRGGVDVAVGRDLFQGLGHSAMAQGSWGAGNTFSSYASAAASVVGGGPGVPTDVAEQQRRMGMLTSGNAAFGSMTSGALAPLYTATSVLGSIGAAGGWGGASEGLRKMSPELLTSVMRGGELPTWASSIGITKGMASGFLNEQRKTPLFEVNDQMFRGTEAGALLKRVREAESGGGSFLDIIREDSKGLKGKAKTRAQMRDVQMLGGVEYASELAPTAEAGAGMFLSQMTQMPEFSALKGHGVGAAKAVGLEGKSLEEQAKVMAGHAKIIADAAATIAGSIEKMATEEAAAMTSIHAIANMQDMDAESVAISMRTAIDVWATYMKSHAEDVKGAMKAKAPENSSHK